MMILISSEIIQLRYIIVNCNLQYYRYIAILIKTILKIVMLWALYDTLQTGLNLKGSHHMTLRTYRRGVLNLFPEDMDIFSHPRKRYLSLKVTTKFEKWNYGNPWNFHNQKFKMLGSQWIEHTSPSSQLVIQLEYDLKLFFDPYKHSVLCQKNSLL